MPSIIIDTDIELKRRTQRSIAVQLTRWFVDRGVESPAHVIVRYTTTPTGSTYSGGWPLAAQIESSSSPDHIQLVVQIAADRDRSFRDELAAEIAKTLAPIGGSPLLSMHFVDVDPADVYVQDGSGRVAAVAQTIKGESSR